MVALLCETYGFDPKTRASRLAWAGLQPDDHRLASLLQRDVIGPHLTIIVNRFFEELGKLPEFWRILQLGQYSLRSLKRSLLQYLATLGRDFDTEGYFEMRLRVGLVHARIGVPLSLYQSAYGLLRRIIIHSIDEQVPEPQTRAELVAFLLQITTLDVALSTEVYHAAHVRGLERSLQEARLAEREMRNRAARDSLTGLSSRDFVMASLIHAIDDAKEQRSPMCLIMADLDHFKDVNDSYGHLVGDEVLRHVSDRMTSVLRSTDLMGRYGGEEFLVLLRDTPMSTAMRVAERMRERVEDGYVEVGALRIPMTISQGVAQVLWSETPSDAIARADAALYAAKQLGRNCVQAYGKEQRRTGG